MTFAEALLSVGCIMLASAAGFFFGARLGRRVERSRCARLCEQTFYAGTLSATARRVYRSILDGDEHVISEDAMFGAFDLRGDRDGK